MAVEPSVPAFKLERPEPGTDLGEFLKILRGRRLRAADPEEMREFARNHPDLAHAQPLVGVLMSEGSLRAAFCIWSRGDAVTFQTVSDQNPFPLGYGWLNRCRVLAFPV